MHDQEITLGEPPATTGEDSSADAGRGVRVLLGLAVAVILGLVGLSALSSFGRDNGAGDNGDEAADTAIVNAATAEPVASPTPLPAGTVGNRLDARVTVESEPDADVVVPTATAVISTPTTESTPGTTTDPDELVSVIPEWSQFTDLYDRDGVLAVRAGRNDISLIDMATGRTTSYESYSYSLSRSATQFEFSATTAGLVALSDGQVVISPWDGSEDLIFEIDGAAEAQTSIIAVQNDRVVTLDERAFATNDFELQVHEIADWSTTTVALPPTATGSLFSWSPGGVDPLTIHGGGGLVRWSAAEGWQDLGPGSSIAHNDHGVLVELCEPTGDRLGCSYSTVTYDGQRTLVHPNVAEQPFFGAVLSDDLTWMASVDFSFEQSGPPGYVLTELATGATAVVPRNGSAFPSGYWLPDSTLFAQISPGQPLRLTDAVSGDEAEITDVPWNDGRSSDDPASARVLPIPFPDR